jgi:acetyl/propionyl-CoA carboxylase alpha subunit
MRRLLVANRGEIARRVLRAARSLGIETVAVFAEDDRQAPHVAEADRAVPLEGGYLDVGRVVEAARRGGADALHPGYGFLSEDPRLAEACAAAGIVWVGPPAGAMAIMGHKARAKATVAAAGVPVLEGREIGAGDEGRLATLAEAVGYPLLVKASAGGGGRGMRLVVGPEGLTEAVAAARHEAAAAFGSDEVFLERYLVSPRHVEVQVVADRHGHVVHLYDRECSIQRRHQKVVEEAPASLVPAAVRRTMWSAAVDAARAVAYEGVGTVEFVVDGEDCAFLEMNTRLQVEHGITELVTGVDLVQLQLMVADGLALPFTQDEVSIGGHAVEARLCAERPRDGYRPTPGPVVHARWPEGDGLRVDAAVETGSVVRVAYDNLVAKVLAVGERRGTAVARLRAALGGPLELDGLETNRDLLAAVLGEVDFLAGRTATDYLDRHPEGVAATLPAGVRRRHAAAASLFLEHLRAAASVVPGAPPSWRNVGRAEHQDRYAEGDDRIAVSVGRPLGGLEVMVEGPGDLAAPLDPELVAEVTVTRGAVDLTVGGVLVRHRVRCHGHLVAVSSPEGQSTLHLAADDEVEQGGAGAGECRAPLPGTVARVPVAVGDAVEDGTALVVLEAMKMEHTLRATGAGTVQQVLAEAGQQVDVGDLLVVTAPPAGDPS